MHVPIEIESFRAELISVFTDGSVGIWPNPLRLPNVAYFLRDCLDGRAGICPQRQSLAIPDPFSPDSALRGMPKSMPTLDTARPIHGRAMVCSCGCTYRFVMFMSRWPAR